MKHNTTHHILSPYSTYECISTTKNKRNKKYQFYTYITFDTRCVFDKQKKDVCFVQKTAHLSAFACAINA